MIYNLESYNINGEAISLDTAALEKNLGTLKFDIKINGNSKQLDVTMRESKNENEEVSIMVAIKNEEFEIDYEELTELEDVYKGIFESIRDSESFVLNKKIDKIISTIAGNALSNLSKNAVIEKVTYSGLFLIYSAEELIGTGLGFKIIGSAIIFTDLDFTIEENNFTIKKYEDNGKLIEIVVENNDTVVGIEITEYEEENKPKELVDLKNLSDFDSQEDYLIYRRSLLIKSSSAANFIDEDLFDDMF